jgi:hypothetical protein
MGMTIFAEAADNGNYEVHPPIGGFLRRIR